MLHSSFLILPISFADAILDLNDNDLLDQCTQFPVGDHIRVEMLSL
jgi:hypothetical protein